MNAAAVTSQTTQSARMSGRRLLWAGPLAIVGAVAANAVVRAIELAVLPVPAEFTALQQPAFLPLTIFGVLAGVIVYAIIGRLSKNGVRTFRIVAGAALLLSFVPDLGLL